MDLSRRRAAGELAALVGARAVPVDREIRIHRFRAEAQRAVSLLSAANREVLDAYVAGVNAGLQALSAPPFEYLLLRQTPAPWRTEDTLLVVLAMFVTLQDDDGSYEAALATMQEVLPPAMVEFLVAGRHRVGCPGDRTGLRTPRRSRAPTSTTCAPGGGVNSQGPTPNSQIRNQTSLRVWIIGWELGSWLGVGNWELGLADRERELAAIGSNSFVVAGRLTDSTVGRSSPTTCT